MAPETSARLVEILAGELAGRGRCLDLGVGTGLIALPLAESGISMAGLDLSAPMLAELLRKAGGLLPFPLAQADATRLPFRAGVFGAAVIRHVLHLIPDWRLALHELVRTVEPGGVILMAHGDIDHYRREIAERFIQSLGRKRVHRGLEPGDLDPVDTFFEGVGAETRSLPEVEDSSEDDLAEFIAQMGEGLHSWTWGIDPDERERAATEVRAWAFDRWGTLDPPGSRKWRIRWRAYELRT